MEASPACADTHPERQWLAVLAIAIGTFVMVTSEFLPIGLLGTMAGDLHVSTGRAGLMVTIPGMVAALSAPALTLSVGRLDRRLLLLFLTGLIVLADVTVALASDLGTVLLGRVMLGLALGASGPFRRRSGAGWSRRIRDIAPSPSSWVAFRWGRWQACRWAPWWAIWRDGGRPLSPPPGSACWC
jgi:MFS family permease